MKIQFIQLFETVRGKNICLPVTCLLAVTIFNLKTFVPEINLCVSYHLYIIITKGAYCLSSCCDIKLIAGYPVCTTLGQPSSTSIDVLGKLFSSILRGKKKTPDYGTWWHWLDCFLGFLALQMLQAIMIVLFVNNSQSSHNTFMSVCFLWQIKRVLKRESLLIWQTVAQGITVHCLYQWYVIQMECKYDFALFFYREWLWFPHLHISLIFYQVATLVFCRVPKHSRMLGSVIM